MLSVTIMGFTKRYQKSTAATLATVAKFAYYKQDEARLRPRLRTDLGLELHGFLYAADTDTEGLVASGNRCVTVAFRGTESARDLLTDIDVKPDKVAFSGRDCRVHGGFWQAYQSVSTQVLELLAESLAAHPRPVYVVGHSLGGALATLCALQLRSERPGMEGDALRVYTFGSPRVGHGDFAELYDEQVPHTYRVINHRDVVPTAPGLRYRHVGTAKRYSPSGQLMHDEPRGVSSTEHKSSSYLRCLVSRSI